MNYLQDEPNESESAIFRDREIQMHKKKETAIWSSQFSSLIYQIITKAVKIQKSIQR